MTQEDYRLELSIIYKEYLADKSPGETLFQKFLNLARKANGEQNTKKAFAKYQKSPKGKATRHREYIKNKEKRNYSNIDSFENYNCLGCNKLIIASFERYTIEGKRPYCEDCFDNWADKHPII